MKKKVRIIPRIDIKNNFLVKGVQLEGLRVLGNPIDFVNKYVNEGADEIFYQDIVASLYGRNSLLEIISKTANVCSVPLIVGGGIRSIEDIESILNAGADKVAINSAGIKNPNFLQEAVNKFGSSTIVSTVEIGKIDNKYALQIFNGREIVENDPIKWIEELQNIGVGEICLTFINNEGTGKGYDLELLGLIYEKVKTQFIVHGGVGNPNHMISLFKNFKVDGFVLSSILHYHYIQRYFDEFYRDNSINDGNLEFLKNLKVPNNIKSLSLKEIKEILSKHNIEIRGSNE